MFIIYFLAALSAIGILIGAGTGIYYWLTIKQEGPLFYECDDCPECLAAENHCHCLEF